MSTSRRRSPVSTGFPPRPSVAARARFRELLLAWYRAERRDLPWRRTKDPWSILVSETMLQQTRVEAVREAWTRFLERFPTPAALARASEDEVLSAWSGLGYYRRARALHAAAQAIVSRGRAGFPRTRTEITALPGVGPYTAGAVLSIAFDLPEAVVDGNVERVFARFYGLDAEAGSRDLARECWALAELCLPAVGGGDWNQALMELGATLCVPRSPDCPRCPLESTCAARSSGRVGELPRKKRRAAPIEVELEILIAERKGRWLLERRPASGRMAGMWQLPTLERSRRDGGTLLFPERFPTAGPSSRAGDAPLGELGHAITRHRIRARLLRASAPAELPDPPFRWCSAEEIPALALTGMAKKAWRQLTDDR